MSLPMLEVKIIGWGLSEFFSYAGGIWKIIASITVILMMPVLRAEFYSEIAKYLVNWDKFKEKKEQESKTSQDSGGDKAEPSSTIGSLLNLSARSLDKDPNEKLLPKKVENSEELDDKKEEDE